MGGYAKRSFVWTCLFYGLCLFGVIYLKDKAELKNSEILFIFVPLLLLGISSESMSKGILKYLKPYNIIDFVLKFAAFFMQELPYTVENLKFDGTLFVLRLIFIAAAFAVSLVMDFLMVKSSAERSEEYEVERSFCAAHTDFDFRRLGRLQIYCGLSLFSSVSGGVLALLFGYTIPFYIIGIPLIAVGLVMTALRTYILIRYGRQLASTVKVIVDAVLIVALIVLSIVFTTGKLVETETGVTIVQNGNMLSIVGFAALYLITFISMALTHQKVGRSYMDMRIYMHKN